jgi:alkanesulfonate monooxygenase SsuD/methylene tetrahydromethanopterin reductase-like flavin-dependent oxidoreductase (luciferase family)
MLTFGVFDHLDDNGRPRAALFDERLRLVGLMERAGFSRYHLAEHHATPLGCAPSPSVFLSAIAQRTRTIRFGPLVYLLPLYHPLRLFEEICMLDQLSGGRLMVGVGRGGALLEHQRHGLDPALAGPMYHEAYDVLMRAFRADVLSYEGRFYKFDDYIVVNKPVQQPHPPIWYGASNVEAAEWAAANAINVVSLGPVARAREIGACYRKTWAEAGRNEADLPLLGITRHVVVAENDDEAQRIARAAYPRWRQAIEFIWQRSNVDFPLTAAYPQSWDELAAVGHGFAGSPARVREQIAELQQQTGINYLVCQIVFGTMGYDEAARSIELFGSEVIPAFAGA